MNRKYTIEDVLQDVRTQRELKEGLKTPSLLAVALAEEAGEVCGVVKKHYRDGASLQCLEDELSDVLWYLTAFADHIGLTLDDLADYNQKKLHARRAAKEKANGV